MSLVGDCFKLVIRRQKNDPEGRGMACWLPKIASLRPTIYSTVGWFIVRLIGPNPNRVHFFGCPVQRTSRLSVYDSWRKALSAHFVDAAGASGTHSLRKGGATWLKFHAMMPEDVVRAQGGWASAEVMQKFYASFPEEAQHVSLERGFERYSFQYHASDLHYIEIAKDDFSAVLLTNVLFG